MRIDHEAKKRIAAVIEKRQLKLAPLAKTIGTSYSTLWNFVYGNTENFGKLQILADALGISLDWIQYGDNGSDPRQRFHDNASPAFHASEHMHKNNFQAVTIPLSVGVELAIKAALQGGKKPADEVLDFVRESLLRLASGAKTPLTEGEFIDYAKGFLAMKK